MNLSKEKFKKLIELFKKGDINIIGDVNIDELKNNIKFNCKLRFCKIDFISEIVDVKINRAKETLLFGLNELFEVLDLLKDENENANYHYDSIDEINGDTENIRFNYSGLEINYYCDFLLKFISYNPETETATILI